MIVTDFFLKFNSIEQLEELFINCGFIVNGFIIKDSENYSLYIIGEIWKPTGVFNQITDSEGNVLQVEEKVKLDGYHANLRLVDVELPEILQPFTIVPQNPMYGWL